MSAMTGRALFAAAVTPLLTLAAGCRPDDAVASLPPSVPAATTGSTSGPTTRPPAPTAAVTTSTSAAGTATPTTAATTNTAATTTTTTTTTTSTTTTALPVDTGSITDVRPASDIASPRLPTGWTTEVIGRSALGRDITALVRSADNPRRSVLVIGGLHGNEPVTPPTVRALVDASIPDDIAVWLVPEANPDGIADGTRWNANGVDLNRNFDWDWRADDGGPGPLSEPESRALATFIDAVRPGVVVWVHQPYGYVGSVGPTERALEQAWATATGLPTRSGVTQHGGGESWTAFVAELPSMLIEIDSWAATPEIVAAHRAGFESLLASLA